MSKDHYSKIKEKQRIKTLKRILNILVECKTSEITLCNKHYRKINFSQAQVAAAMNQFATTEEKLNGLVITNPSSFSHNETYKQLIDEAKIARKEFEISLLGESGLTGNIDLDYITLKRDYDILNLKYKNLMSNYKSLEAIITSSNKDIKTNNSQEISYGNENINCNFIELEKYELLKNTTESIINILRKNEQLLFAKGEGLQGGKLLFINEMGDTEPLLNESEMIKLELFTKQDLLGN